MAKNRTIGVKGQLPWQLSEDLQRFKQITMGQTLLMGRKTYESIGRPLPGRQTIVLSRNRDYRVDSCLVVDTIEAGLAATQTDELFICGGAEIYRQALPLVEKIYLTELQSEISGDAYFPDYLACQFEIIQREELVDNGVLCNFSILQRIKDDSCRSGD